MSVLLYRRSLRLRSGAGELIRMQAAGLRAAGERVRIGCERGAVGFVLGAGSAARYMSLARADAYGRRGDWLVVDHGMHLPHADVVFVHNVMAEAGRYLERGDVAEEGAREAAFFAALDARAPIVANSRLVQRALVERFALDPARIVVHYPGYRADRFDRARAAALREPARRALGITADAPLVGFVTSGDFEKRGLDLFLAAAERIAHALPAARFLVVGSKRLPPWIAGQRLARGGALLHRPKSAEPERWFAALDVFLYAARFEEFGLVVAEAAACGLPVVTSRRVGAAECLPAEYAPWIAERPEAAELAERTLALLGDARTRAKLGAAGAEAIRPFDRERYVAESLATILGQKR